MAKKIAWHTDIVVGGQGMNLKLTPDKKGCYALKIMPDTPGRSAQRAIKRFKKALAKEPKACLITPSKNKVFRAIKATQADWNHWHLEMYR